MAHSGKLGLRENQGEREEGEQLSAHSTLAGPSSESPESLSRMTPADPPSQSLGLFLEGTPAGPSTQSAESLPQSTLEGPPNQRLGPLPQSMPARPSTQSAGSLPHTTPTGPPAQPLGLCDELYATSWFQKLLCLQYILSLTVLIDLVYYFEYTTFVNYVNLSASSLIKDYAVWFAVDFGILFFFALLIGDLDVRLLWSKRRIGKYLSEGVPCMVAWVVVITSLVGLSVFVDVESYINKHLISVIWGKDDPYP